VSATSEIRIREVHEAPWPDVESVFRVVRDASTCWCQWFKVSRSEFREREGEGHRACLEESAKRPETSPGLLAYRDGRPAGWVAVEPRPRYSRLRRSRNLKLAEPGIDLDDGSVWSVTCFVVPREHRGQGVTRALLDGAVALARRRGAAAIEGYPVDTATARASSDALYVGVLSTFLAAGFSEVSRMGATQVLVRLPLR